ncbi:MAG: hypothetical protein ACLQQ4_14100 [Bacteroidia bacterium]
MRHRIKIILWQSVLFIVTALSSIFAPGLSAQKSPANESQLKKQANNYFEDGNYDKAFLQYSQLLANSPQNPNYNYRFGACMLFSQADKKKPVDYIETAVKQPGVDNLAYYYLGRAYHLNYRFDDAIKAYQHFKQYASSSELKKYPVDHLIEMCNNGKQLLGSLHDLDVLRKKELDQADYYQAYDLSSNGGSLLVEPEEFKSKIDKKKNFTSIIYLSPDKSKLFFASYGDDDKNGKDIYIAYRLPNGAFGKPTNLGSVINTPYDEDYPFYDEPTHTLYFCSMGHNSMGGYDIFRSVYNDVSNSWSKPVNMDFPINTPGDDILFIADTMNETAFFSSNRSSPNGKMMVYRIVMQPHPPDYLVINGTTYNDGGNTATASRITVKDAKTNEVVGVFNSSADNGNYTMNLANGGHFLYTVETANHKTQSGSVTLPMQNELTPIQQLISYEPSTDRLIIKNSSQVAVSDSNYLLAMDVIEKKAALEVNVDTTAPMRPFTPVNFANPAATVLASNTSSPDTSSTEIDTASDIAIDTTGKNGVSSSQLEQIAKNDADQQQAEAQQEKDEANQAIEYATNKITESQQLARQAGEVAARADSIKYTKQKDDTLARAAQLKQQSDEAGKKAMEAFQLASQLEIQASVKQKEANQSTQYVASLDSALKSPDKEKAIKKLQAQRDSLQKQDEANPPATPTAADLIRVQAQNTKQDSVETVKHDEDLQKEADRLQQESEDYVSQSQKTNDPNEKVALLEQARDLANSKKEKENEIKENQKTLVQLHDRYNNLSVQATQIDSVTKSNPESQQLASTEANSLKEDIKNYNQAQNQVNPVAVNNSQQNPEQVNPNAANNNANNNQPNNPVAVNNTQQNPEQVNPNAANNNANNNQPNNPVAVNNTQQNPEQVNNNAANNNANNNQPNNPVAVNSTQQNPEQVNPNAANSNANNNQPNNPVAVNSTQQNPEQVNPNAANNNANNNQPNNPVAVNNTQQNPEQVNPNAANNNANNNQPNNPVAVNNTQQNPEQVNPNAAANNNQPNNTVATNNTQQNPEQINPNPTGDTTNNGQSNNPVAVNNTRQNPEQVNANPTSDTTNNIQPNNPVTVNNAQQNPTIGNVQEPSVNYTNPQASQSNKSANEFNNESTALAKQAEDARDQARQATTPQQAEVYSLKADSLDDASQEQKIVATIYTNNADSAQYLTNKQQLAAWQTAMQSNSSIKVTRAQLLAQDANMYYTQALKERQKADNTAVPFQKQIYLDNAQQFLDSALDKQQQAHDMMLQVNPDLKNVTPQNVAVVSLSQPNNSAANNQQQNPEQVNPAAVTYNNNNNEPGNPITINNAQTNPGQNLNHNNQPGNLVAANNSQQNPAQVNPVSDTTNANHAVNPVVVNNTQQNPAQVNPASDTTTANHAVNPVVVNNTQQNPAQVNPASDTTHANHPVNPVVVNNTQQNPAQVNPAPDTTNANQPVNRVVINNTQQTPAQASQSNVTNNNTSQPANPVAINHTQQPVQVNPHTVTGNNNQAQANNPQQNAETANNTNTPSALGKIDEIKELPASPYSKAHPIPINPPLPEGLIYKIQIGAFLKPIPQNAFKGLEPIEGETTGKGFTRYTAGIFKDLEKAKNAQTKIHQLGYHDAFIVAFLNGKRVSINEAAGVQKVNPAPQQTGVVATNNNQPENNNQPAVTPTQTQTGNTVSAIPVNKQKGLFFTVQIGAFKSPVTVDKLYGLTPLFAHTAPTGLIRYNCGIYSSEATALTAKNAIVNKTPVKDAFVVAYYNGERISIAEATKLLNDKKASVTQNSDLDKAPVRNGEGTSARTLKEAEVARKEAQKRKADSIASAKKEVKQKTADSITSAQNASNTAAAPDTTGKVEQQRRADSIALTKIVDTTAFPEGTVYSVQVANFSGKLSKEVENEILGVAMAHGLSDHKAADGNTLYSIGKYFDYDSANTFKTELINEGITDAIIVEFVNNVPVRYENAPSATHTKQNKGKAHEQTTPAARPDTNNNTPVNTITPSISTPGKVIFTVQVGAYSGQIPVDVANKLINIANQGLKTHGENNGITAYTLGEYTNYVSAKLLKDELVQDGFPGCFVVAYHDGKKISLQQAQSLTNK